MPKVYIETTIPSYLAAKPSRDIIVAAQQQVTVEWRNGSLRKHDLYISEAVIDECGTGDQEVAGRRMKFIRNLPVLQDHEGGCAGRLNLREAARHPGQVEVGRGSPRPCCSS